MTSRPPVVWTFWDFLAILLAGWLAALAVLPLVSLFTEAVFLWVILTPAQYIGHMLAMVLILRRKRASAEDDLGLRILPRDVLYVGVGLIMAFAIVLLAVPFLSILESEENAQALVTQFQAIDSTLVRLTAILSILVIAPVVEEALFRGVLLRRLLVRRSRAAATTISAVVFGTVHIATVDFTLPHPLLRASLVVTQITLLGFALAWMVIRDERLGRAIFAHSGVNLLTVLGLLLPPT